MKADSQTQPKRLTQGERQAIMKAAMAAALMLNAAGFMAPTAMAGGAGCTASQYFACSISCISNCGISSECVSCNGNTYVCSNC